MIFRPTSSYQIELPENIRQKTDERVSSFWIDHRPLLLQLSSYQRADGTQETAARRLLDRIDKTPSDWKHLTLKLSEDPSVDQAAAEQPIGDLVWLHCYFVWAHLTVYATVSGPEEELHNPQNWAVSALRNLSLVVQ